MPDNDMRQIKVLLCTVPDGSLEVTIDPTPEEDAGRAFQATLGIQSLVNWMDKNGYDNCYEYYDINNLRPSDEALRKHFAEFSPTVVGLSAPLSHCYPNVKRISAILRDMFPNVWIVVGGHVTASSKVILNKTEADICVVGDGEIAWLELLKYFETTRKRVPIDGDLLKSVRGLSFYDHQGSFQFSGYGEQLPSDELNFIDFEFMKSGLRDRPEVFRNFFPLSKLNPDVQSALIDKDSPYYRENSGYDPDAGGTMVSIPTSKGCVAKCTFCQRYTKGYRVYDLEKLEEYVLDLKEKYNVDLFSIADENFGSNIKQAYQVAEIFKKCGVFWQAGGARCTSFKYEDLKFFKEHNCIYIKFGVESGSQTILDIMEKKFKREDVVSIFAQCKELGLLTTADVLMLGMPGETSDTVVESANLIGQLRYILKLDNNIGGTFWATAFPGTPLYEYSQQIGIVGTSIDEEEAWLYRLSESKTTLYNYSNQTGEDVKTIFFWSELFTLEGKRAYLDYLLKDRMPLVKTIQLIFSQCVKHEFEYYICQIKALHSKASPEYVGDNMSGIKKVRSHGAAATRFILSLANLILPRSVVFPMFKYFSDIKYAHIKKNHASTIGRLNLFQEQKRANEKLLVTPARLKAKQRQQERSLRSIVRENREYFSNDVKENDEKHLTLASGQ